MLNCVERYYGDLDNSKLPAASDLAKEYLRRCDSIKSRILDYHPIQALELLNAFDGEYISAESLSSVLAHVSEVNLGNNQFYSIYDIPNFKYLKVDDRIREILGFSPERFRMTALCGLEADNPLFHPEDVNHVIRWGNIAYAVASLPGIIMNMHRDYYHVVFRISTSQSEIESVRRKGYVALSKDCYISSNDDLMALRPRYHFDRWTVYNSREFQSVAPRFVSGGIQEGFMNSMLCLFNACLLGVSVKTMLLLNLKVKHERNKAIANEFNDRLRRFSKTTLEITENKVADTFTKTTRREITNIMRIWDKNPSFRMIQGDLEAARASRILGLLPMDPLIEEIAYSLITD